MGQPAGGKSATHGLSVGRREDVVGCNAGVRDASARWTLPGVRLDAAAVGDAITVRNDNGKL